MVRWLAVAILLAGLVGFPGVPARAEAPTAPAPRRPAPEEAPPEAPTPPLPVGIAPTVIAPATVLEFGRRKATFLTAAPSAAYQFTPLTFATATYTYTHDTIQDGESTTVNSPVLRLSHQFTSLDTGTLGYRVAVYDIEGSP